MIDKLLLSLGIRNLDPAQLFTATLRSTTSAKSDDHPPPYDDELPPPYNEAIKMAIHTREEECKAETTIVKLCLPSTSNAQPDVIRPSTSHDEQEHQPQSSVEIVIPSPGETTPSISSNEEESDHEAINRNNSTSVHNVSVPNGSDGDETDGRNKKEHLKCVSMTVVL